MLVIEEGKENLFDRDYMKYVTEEEDNTVSYKGTEMPLSHVKSFILCKGAKDIPIERAYEMIKMAYDEGISLSPFSAKEYIKSEHKGKADIFVYTYTEKGNTDINDPLEDTISDLTKAFSANQRYNGRVPAITPVIASVMDFYKEYGHDMESAYIVDKFNVNIVRNLVNSGITKADAINIFCAIPNNYIPGITGKKELCEMISSLITKGIKKDTKFIDMAVWISSHPNTNIDFLRDLYDNRKDIKFDKDMNVEGISTQISYKDAEKQVKKVEKAYKDCNFHLSDCKCLLRDNPTESGKYRARILDGDDPLQVMLGEDEITHCCQVLGDAGETSMMYGLTNDHAGFFVIENKNTGKIYAQAESWEWDKDTLVFDNIEFANDADIKLYKEILGEYIINSPYKNIIMGKGWNELDYDDNSFENGPHVYPHVTPKDIYIMSYEEDAEVFDGKDASEVLRIPSIEKAKELLDSGKVTYYDYLYSDVDDGKGTAYLKKDGKVADYFGIDIEKQKNAYMNNLSAGSIMEKALFVIAKEEKEYLREEKEYD